MMWQLQMKSGVGPEFEIEFERVVWVLLSLLSELSNFLGYEEMSSVGGDMPHLVSFMTDSF
jgi:hypothetical protein